MAAPKWSVKFTDERNKSLTVPVFSNVGIWIAQEIASRKVFDKLGGFKKHINKLQWGTIHVGHPKRVGI